MRIGRLLPAVAVLLAAMGPARADCRLEDPPQVALRFWNDNGYLNAQRRDYLDWVDRATRFNDCVVALHRRFNHDVEQHNTAVQAGRASPVEGGSAGLEQRREVVEATLARREALVPLNEAVKDIWGQIQQRRSAAGL